MFLKKQPKSINRLIYFFATALVIFPFSVFAIVNMDALHFDKQKDTFSVDFDFTISGASGNSDQTKTALNSQFTWLAEKSINLAVLGYQYGESNNLRSVNKAFVHYRYIHQLKDTMDLELFTQLETNEFTRLSYRGLVGAGLRFSMFNTSSHRAFIGTGLFYSKEKTEFISGLTDGGVEKLSRGNFYFLSKFNITSSISFSNVIYYQPRLSHFSDYRALLESKFDFKINKNLSFRLILDVSHDTEPSQSIESTDISYMSGLKFNF